MLFQIVKLFDVQLYWIITGLWCFFYQ